MTIALYVGSFNPLHDGHIDIAMQAAHCFDLVYVVKGQNVAKGKNKNFTKKEFEKLAGLPSSCAAQYRPNETILDLVKIFSADVIVRGLRNHYDLLEAKNYVYTVKRFFREQGCGAKSPEFVFFFPSTERLLFTSSSNERQLEAAKCLHKR